MTPTDSAGEPASVLLARAHAGMTGYESRQHALALADFAEAQSKLIAIQLAGIDARDRTITTFVETAEMIAGLLSSGRSRAARRLAAVLAAYVPAEPSGVVAADLALPDALFNPIPRAM